MNILEAGQNLVAALEGLMTNGEENHPLWIRADTAIKSWAKACHDLKSRLELEDLEELKSVTDCPDELEDLEVMKTMLELERF